MKMKMSLLTMLLTAVFLLTGIHAEAYDGVDWTNNYITVTGSGVPMRGTVGAQARMLAKRAAIADAYRQLAEAVNGVQVDAETNVELMMTQSDVVRLKVSALVKGAQVVSENITPDGGYEVTMRLPMFGANSLAGAVLERPAQREPFYQPQPSTSVTITVRGGYTGVIVDCRGFRVNPVMSPVIKNANGTNLYGHKNLDPDFVIANGMASYASSMSEATRAGSNPLVIKAVRMENFDAYPVVSVSDGDLMLYENQSARFLDNTAVVFLY